MPPRETGWRRRRIPPVELIRRIGSGRSSPDSLWSRCISESASRKFDRSFIGAFLPDLFSVINHFLSIDLFRGWAVGVGFLVPICPSRCTFPRSSLFWVANHHDSWISLKAIVNSFNCLLDKSFLFRALWVVKCSFYTSVLPCRTPRGSPFLMTLFWIEKTSSRHWWKCWFFDSNNESILSIAVREWSRTTRITLHCPLHRSSLSNHY